LSLITATFEGEARNRAVAWYGASAGIGASLGLLVGGAVTDLVSWRAAFGINVPIAAAMVIGACAVLVESPRARGRFDVVGALCATGGIGAIVFGIIESSESGWGSRGSPRRSWSVCCCSSRWWSTRLGWSSP
jgi:MFS family permease